jgi:pantothenate kinase
LQNAAWRRLSQSALFLDQTSALLEFTRAEVEQYFEPLARYLIERNSLKERLLAVIAGPPGSGKSAFAALLVAVINALAGADVSLVVGMDGWHFTNAYLDSHTIKRNGQPIPLRRLKGSPETFDIDAAFACLSQIRAGGRVHFPVYSRLRHDPIEKGGTVEDRHKIVIVEGNYWLLNEDPWRKFLPLFDIRIFLTGNPKTFIDGLVQRHVRGGRSPEDARRYVDAVDAVDILRVLDNHASPDIVVHKIDSRRLKSIDWPGAGPDEFKNKSKFS